MFRKLRRRQLEVQQKKLLLEFTKKYSWYLFNIKIRERTKFGSTVFVAQTLNIPTKQQVTDVRDEMYW